MRPSAYVPAALALLLAAIAALATAVLAVGRIEDSAREGVRSVLVADGQDWVEVSVDGLLLTLGGTAPDEATRFRALSLAGSVVDATRVIDAMDVDPGDPVAAPRFSIEILRNDDGISLIGLVPDALDRAAVADVIAGLAGGVEVIDLLQAADYPVPAGWAEALEFALEALASLPRSKISVSAGEVSVTAISTSAEEKRRIETSLRSSRPESVQLTLDISAPRPVVTPFTLRFLIDDRGARFDACTAHTEQGRDRILAAAREAGMTTTANCTLALGVPSPRWPDAAVASIAALAELGSGTVTLSDADISLVARQDVADAQFDRVVGELEAGLPEVFSLTASKPEPVILDTSGDGDQGPAQFVATLSPEGLLALRGRMTDARLRDAVTGFARARFTGTEVSAAMRIDDSLPDGWTARVFAGLESLSLLSNGALIVQPDFVDITGTTGDAEARAEIARILAAQLGDDANYELDITYVEALDPVAQQPTPQECVDAINAVLTARKITFAPGSADIDADALATIDRIAEVLADCSEVRMEIAGHTDSQGRESMNLALSQQRAEAVLVALQARRILTGNLEPRGYGEAEPIADNDTEEGREANRRIEFVLIDDGTAGTAEELEAEADPGQEPPQEPDPDAPAAEESGTEGGTASE